MNILVTGANGFVGRALCVALHDQGYRVRAATRSSLSFKEDIDCVNVTDTDNRTHWGAALKHIDVVIHLAARVHVMQEDTADALALFRKVNVEGTVNLARQAVSAGVKRFVFMSSIGVNGVQSILPFTELDQPQPHNAYAQSKWEAEQELQRISQESGLEVVIIRPPLIYGAKAPGNFARLMRVVKCKIPLPLGAIHNRRSFIYVGNVVSIISLCITHPAAANQVFLVADGHDLSTSQLLQTCAKALGVRSWLLPVPQKWIEWAAVIFGRHDLAQRLCGNLQIDIGKVRNLLGWNPPFLVEDGLRKAAESDSSND